MGTVELDYDDIRVVLSDAPVAGVEQPIPTHQIIIEAEWYPKANFVTIVGYRNITPLWQTLVELRDWRSPIIREGAVISEGILAVVLGQFVVGFDVQSGAMLWQQEGDHGGCFGLHLNERHRCLIVHGELEITRLNLNGEVAWRTSGKDIFTGPFAVADDTISATDWDGNIYQIDIETRNTAIVGQGIPFPHTEEEKKP